VIERFYVREVEILEPSTGTDRYGSAAVTWPGAGRLVQGWLSQTGQDEPQGEGRDPLVTSHVLFLPAGTAIDGRSRVLVDGHTFTVEGEPHEAWTPAGAHHLEVRLQEVVG
jgi:hypothetical protein